jgi:exopolyphosphatase/pppGpp-phosphohydrolase
VLGTLQPTAKAHPAQVKAKAACWLRTISANTSSESVTRIALSIVFNEELYGFGKTGCPG